MIELGVPFSDPLADGPVIQRAMERAVARGVRLADVLQLAREIRAERPAAGLVIFSYLNPILRYGLSRFADDAAAAGVDGVLATDMIVEEAGEYLAELARVGLAPIFLAAPTSPDERLEAIATHSKGFVYAISRTGITGTQQTLTSDAAALVAASGDGPRCRWPWGSASPMRNTSPRWREFADAAVVGSAIVELIERSTAGDSARRSGSIYQGPAPASGGAGPVRSPTQAVSFSRYIGIQLQLPMRRRQRNEAKPSSWDATRG